jgi:UDP-glucuronate 4-epimerase
MKMVALPIAHLHGLPATGLRFFTVYGPAGGLTWPISVLPKPSGGHPIQVFNHGQLERDFTYIDDIVAGVLAVAAAPPTELQPPFVC